MRILQVIETGGPGGAETVFAQLATGLRQRGHAIECLVGRGNWLPAELESRGICPEYMHNGGSVDLPLLRQIVSLIRRHRIEIVHVHLFDAAVYAAMASILCRVRCITTLHGQVDIQRHGLTARVKARVLRLGSTTVVAVSNALRDDLQSVLRIPAPRFQVVYNGVAQHEAPTGMDAIRGRVRADAEAFRLVAVGNIRPAKDYPTLLHSLRSMRQMGLNVHLDILGQPDNQGLFESLQAMVTQLDIAPNVTFHGFVENPHPFVAQADAFVLASTREGFSLATIEAMLAGTPVVATRSGGPEEIIVDGVTGLLVPTREPVALASAVQRLANEEALSQSLTEAAGESVRSRFSVSAMLDGYEALYREALAR